MHLVVSPASCVHPQMRPMHAGFLLTHDGEMASVLLALEHGAMCKKQKCVKPKLGLIF